MEPKTRRRRIVRVTQEILLKILIKMLPNGYYHPN